MAETVRTEPHSCPKRMRREVEAGEWEVLEETRREWHRRLEEGFLAESLRMQDSYESEMIRLDGILQDLERGSSLVKDKAESTVEVLRNEIFLLLGQRVPRRIQATQCRDEVESSEQYDSAIMGLLCDQNDDVFQRMKANEIEKQKRRREQKIEYVKQLKSLEIFRKTRNIKKIMQEDCLKLSLFPLLSEKDVESCITYYRCELRQWEVRFNYLEFLEFLIEQNCIKNGTKSDDLNEYLAKKKVLPNLPHWQVTAALDEYTKFFREVGSTTTFPPPSYKKCKAVKLRELAKRRKEAILLFQAWLTEGNGEDYHNAIGQSVCLFGD